MITNSEKTQDIIEYGWIPLDAALPPRGKSVLIRDEKTISFGSYEVAIINEYKIDSDSRVRYKWKSVEPCVHNPTHWMPLPLIP